MKYYQYPLTFLFIVGLLGCAAAPIKTDQQPISATNQPRQPDTPTLQTNVKPLAVDSGATSQDSQPDQTPLSATQLKEFLKKVDEQVYSPINEGLRSLRVVMKDSSAEKNFKEFKDMQMVIYWQYPDKRKVRFETPAGVAVDKSSLNFLFSDAIGMLDDIVPLPFARRAVTYNAGSPSKPESMQIKISPPSWDVVQEERIYNFNKDFLPFETSTARQGMFSHIDQIEYQQKEGKNLLKQITRSSTTDMGKSTIQIKYSYTKVDKYWFLAEVLIGQNNQSITFNFENYRINEKLDEKIFQ